MSAQRDMVNEPDEDGAEADTNGSNIAKDNDNTAASRKERRKAAKKEKRKKKRQEVAELTRRKEEARLDDPDELMRLQAEEEQERLRVERERMEFEERERRIIEDWERKKSQEQREEEERRKAQEEEQLKQIQIEGGNDMDEDGWEYVEDGPPEIIWQGNEIIVKKKKIRVKRDRDQHSIEEDPNRPTSNPLPPQSEAYADYKNAPVLSAQELLENVAQETPNFGTEQDKAHCPFHLKTGACRFGSRCSRIHFYPDKSCTLLIKNMYNGPGLAWEQDEGLEYTDEEVEHAYEEYYEDVHTEFLKFGEIVNFKVCRNGSSHLRGNVYVHYKSLESAVLAYQSINGRYYAGKQIQCEFVGVTRWKVAICGEFMRSKLQTCSRGTACNFIHCFRNPGGDYEWADWDKQPPKYWLKKMAALFGHSGDYGYDKEQESPGVRKSHRISADDADRYHIRRSRSREIIHSSRSSRKYPEDNYRSSVPGHRHRIGYKKDPEIYDDKASNFREKHGFKSTSSDSDSDINISRDRVRDSCDDSTNHYRARKHRKLDTQSSKSEGISTYENDSGSDLYNHHRHERSSRPNEKRVKRNRDAGSGRGWSDKDRIEGGVRSGTATGEMQCNSDSTSPDDHWDVRDSTHVSNVTGNWSDEEQNHGLRCKEKCPRFYDSEEHEKFTRESDYRKKRSSNWDDLARWDAEVENENVNHSSRKYGSSDSSSRYYKRGESERHSSHHKKSKRKRDPEKELNTESQILYSERKSSHATDCRIDEAVHDRGRWEPDQDNSAMEEPLQ